MIYYDHFAGEYVTEKEKIAPPERYLAYMKGPEGIYTEKYRICVEGGLLFMLDFSYSEFEKTNYPQLVVKNRQSHFKTHNVNPNDATRIAYIVPPSVYNKIIKEWNLKQKG